MKAYMQPERILVFPLQQKGEIGRDGHGCWWKVYFHLRHHCRCHSAFYSAICYFSVIQFWSPGCGLSVLSVVAVCYTKRLTSSVVVSSSVPAGDDALRMCSDLDWNVKWWHHTRDFYLELNQAPVLMHTPWEQFAPMLAGDSHHCVHIMQSVWIRVSELQHFTNIAIMNCSSHLLPGQNTIKWITKSDQIITHLFVLLGWPTASVKNPATP